MAEARAGGGVALPMAETLRGREEDAGVRPSATVAVHGMQEGAQLRHGARVTLKVSAATAEPILLQRAGKRAGLRVPRVREVADGAPEAGKVVHAPLPLALEEVGDKKTAIEARRLQCCQRGQVGDVRVLLDDASQPLVGLYQAEVVLDRKFMDEEKDDFHGHRDKKPLWYFPFHNVPTG